MGRITLENVTKSFGETEVIPPLDLTIEDGEFKGVSTGGVEKPTLNVMMDASKFVEMANGDLDGRKAFLTRKLKVKGNIALAQKMQKFFPQG